MALIVDGGFTNTQGQTEDQGHHLPDNTNLSTPTGDIDNNPDNGLRIFDGDEP